MDGVTVYLEKTNAAQFYRWLASYSDKRLGERKQYTYSENAKVSVLWYAPSSIGHSYNLNARVLTEVAQDEVNQKDYPDVINIEWLEVGDRLKLIIAHRTEFWVMWPIIDFMIDISEDWPKTKRELSNYLLVKAKNHDIDLSTRSLFPEDDKQKEIISRQTQKEHIQISPRRVVDHDRWVMVWNKIKGWVHQGYSLDEIMNLLDKRKQSNSYKGTIFSKDTMAKIIKAGNEGELTS